MPRFCDERKWNAAVANQLMKIRNRINNLTWHKKHAGMKNLTGLSISFHGSVVRPAVNGGARASVWTWGDVALQIRCTASLAISPSWGGGGSVSLFSSELWSSNASDLSSISYLPCCPVHACSWAGWCDSTAANTQFERWPGLPFGKRQTMLMYIH